MEVGLCKDDFLKVPFLLVQNRHAPLLYVVCKCIQVEIVGGF